MNLIHDQGHQAALADLTEQLEAHTTLNGPTTLCHGMIELPKGGYTIDPDTYGPTASRGLASEIGEGRAV